MNLDVDSFRTNIWDTEVFMPELASYTTSSSYGYSAFSNAPAYLFKNALSTGAIDDTKKNAAPSISECLRIAEEAENEFTVTFSGFRILPPREDVKVVVDKLTFSYITPESQQPLSEAVLEQFPQLSNADEATVTDQGLTLYWD